jgi:hypothetical protein
MDDIGTLSSHVLGPLVSEISHYLPSVPSTNEIRQMLHSEICTSVCEQSADSGHITVTSTGDSTDQPTADQTPATQLSYDDLLELLDKIPKTIPKGMKWGDLGWYLIAAEACVFVVGYAYSTLTGRSLIVTWTGELPRSQVTPSASPDEPIDRDTWASLIQVFAKLKPAEIGSQTPHMEMKVDGQSFTASYLTPAGWVCRTFHVKAATVCPPGSIEPDMNMPFDGDEGTHPDGSSEDYSSDDDPTNTPSASESDDDDIAQPEEVQPRQGQNRQSTGT